MSLFSKPRAKHLSIGERGEKAAIQYLKKNRYVILDTNFCNKKGRRVGEIDIVAKKDDELVFVEVKTRTLNNDKKVLPEENITRSKLYKLNKAATFYIKAKNLHSFPYRFDAITLVADPDCNVATLRHLKNIFL